jgi:hypothetical protein
VPTVAIDAATLPTSDAYAVKTGNEFSNISASGASMNFTFRPAVWVDFAANPAVGNGSFLAPYASLTTGVSASAPGGLVMIKPGSTTAKPVITKNVVLRSYLGTANVGVH